MLDLEPPLQLVGKEQVRELAPPVRPPLGVPGRELEVVRVERAELAARMHHAADGHDPRRRAREEPAEQQAGEREVPQVVGADLHLEAVDRLPARDGHDACVVHEGVEPDVLAQEALGEGADGGETRYVELTHLDLRSRVHEPDAVGRGAPFLRAPACQHDRPALLGQRARGFEADAAVRARDDEGLAREVGDVALFPASCHGFGRP